MALTYTRKLAKNVAANDKISTLVIQATGAREYSGFAGGDGSVDERPTVVSKTQVKADNETVRDTSNDVTDNDGSATGPVTLFLSGGRDASSVQTVVLAPHDAVIVSTGTPAAGD